MKRKAASHTTAPTVSAKRTSADRHRSDVTITTQTIPEAQAMTTSDNNFNLSKPSFLMLLPVEIRLLIFEYVVGQQVLHIDLEVATFIFHEFDQQDIHKPPIETFKPPKGLYYYLCEAKGSEQAYYERWLEGKCPHRTWTNRHARCLSASESVEKGYTERRPTIGLLRVCHQIHKEAYKTLYSTSTFTFTTPETFKRFVQSVSLDMLQVITTLSFRFAIYGAEGAPYGAFDHFENVRRVNSLLKLWNQVWAMHPVRSMERVQTLHLHIEISRNSYGYNTGDDRLEDRLKKQMTRLKRFRCLRRATIVMCSESSWEGRAYYDIAANLKDWLLEKTIVERRSMN